MGQLSNHNKEIVTKHIFSMYFALHTTSIVQLDESRLGQLTCHDYVGLISLNLVAVYGK